jgi:hypothetical protein
MMDEKTERGLVENKASVPIADPHIDLSVSRETHGASQSVIDRTFQIEHIVLICVHNPATFGLSHTYPEDELLAEDMNSVETNVSTQCTDKE